MWYRPVMVVKFLIWCLLLKHDQKEILGIKTSELHIASGETDWESN